MKRLSSLLQPTLAALLLAGCGVPEAEDSVAAAQHALDSSESAHESESVAPEQADISESSDSELNASKVCYTTCSSDPKKGWTKTYKVGNCSTAAGCDTAAAGFCKGLSSGYKFHNSACT